MTPEQINETYKPRIESVLNAIADELKADGWSVSEVCDMSCDEYRYSILATPKWQQLGLFEDAPAESDIDITFEIHESEHCDGSENGVAFGVNVVTVGGAIVGDCTPCNYSDDLWVSRDNADAIEERFELVEGIDPAGMADLIADHKA